MPLVCGLKMAQNFLSSLSFVMMVTANYHDKMRELN